MFYILGSHDSFSFWVDEKSPVGPDQAASIKRLAKISLVKKLMKKWSVTQNLTFKEQLESGIRYFDLRVSSKPEEGREIYFIHGLYGIRVWDGLTEINTFLNNHSKEVVLLDFNHFYAMEHEHHLYLLNMLQEVFGSKLCPAECVENITLQYVWEKNYQVFHQNHFTKLLCTILIVRVRAITKDETILTTFRTPALRCSLLRGPFLRHAIQQCSGTTHYFPRYKINFIV